MSDPLDVLLNEFYAAQDGSDAQMIYDARHGIESASILTITNDEIASLVAHHLEPRIAGKTVVEIGGGIGLLAMHLGLVAKRVYCIDSNPFWASSFIVSLLKNKPKNVSYLFGAADEFSGHIKGDVAIFCTHSGIESMKIAAVKFAPVVIDVYGELIANSPDSFDKTARILRSIA